MFLGLILIFLGFVTLLMQDFGVTGASGQIEMGSIDLKSKDTQEKINRHLQETSRKMYLQEQRSQIESRKIQEEVRKMKAQEVYHVEPSTVDIPNANDRHYFNEQVGRGRKDFGSPQDPSQMIQEQLFREESERQFSEAYKKEYTRQFIENARAGGWEIKVDDSFRIISVKPIKRKPAENVFSDDGYNSGGQ